MARRIAVKGGLGSGKSTLSGALARCLDVPHVELDALYWGPNWKGVSAEQLRKRVVDALDDEPLPHPDNRHFLTGKLPGELPAAAAGGQARRHSACC